MTMKTINSIIVIFLFVAGPVFAGGIVTNTNQSAEFMRTLNRNASTDMDAVYYNPASLTKLGDGFHIYLSNQTIIQTRTINASYPTFNKKTFEGETFAPVFPNIYLAYKTGNMALSAGLTPIGGGGSAEYPAGLPAFEYTLGALSEGVPASVVAPALAPYGTINGYSLDAAFNGSSIYLGLQAGLSYAINEMLSVAGGVRFVSAKNTYEGYLKNITLLTDTDPTGTGSRGQIPGAVIGELFMDKEVDAERTGSALTGIVGLNISLEKLNIGARYEHLTKLEMVNNTTKDDVDLFPDGEAVASDMPAMVAVGAAYQVMPQLNTEVSYTYYMNTGVDWDGQENYVVNGNEVGIAFEYSLSEALAASVGVLSSTSGAEDRYQSDLSYSLNSSSIGLGVNYSFNPNLAVTLGFSNTFYENGQNDYDLLKQKETYEKTAMVFAIGFKYIR